MLNEFQQTDDEDQAKNHVVNLQSFQDKIKTATKFTVTVILKFGTGVPIVSSPLPIQALEEVISDIEQIDKGKSLVIWNHEKNTLSSIPANAIAAANINLS